VHEAVLMRYPTSIINRMIHIAFVCHRAYLNQLNWGCPTPQFFGWRSFCESECEFARIWLIFDARQSRLPLHEGRVRTSLGQASQFRGRVGDKLCGGLFAFARLQLGTCFPCGVYKDCHLLEETGKCTRFLRTFHLHYKLYNHSKIYRFHS